MLSVGLVVWGLVVIRFFLETGNKTKGAGETEVVPVAGVQKVV